VCAVAERFLVKNSNVPHVVFEIDGESGRCEFVLTPEAAFGLLQDSVPLSQQERVETNTMPSTLTPHTLSKEDKACYEKLTKVWQPKEGAHDALMLDLEALGDQAMRSSAELVKKREAERKAAEEAQALASDVSDSKVEEALEVEELKNLFSSGGGGPASKRGPASAPTEVT
jgi:hypothetical protein